MSKGPFVIALCGTPHRLTSGEMPQIAWQWYEYLSNIERAHTKLEIVKLSLLAGAVVIKSEP